MDSTLAKLSSNWPQIGGCEFSEALQLQDGDPDVFKRPTLDELVSEDRSILLAKGENPDCCELLIKLFPHYKIQAFSLACNENKVEVFQGQTKEYLETIYGVVIDDCEDEQFKTYRYDVEVDKSGITELLIKFPSQSTEMCLFGIIIQTAPNPNGITTMLPQSSVINMDNAKSILKNSATLPQSSGKCLQLLELMERVKAQPSSISPTNANAVTEEQWTGSIDASNTVALKKYIDERLLALEDNFSQRLLQLEQRQMEKMDCIIRLLENINNK